MMRKKSLIILSLFVAVSAIFAQNTERELPPSFRFENDLIPKPQVYEAVLEQSDVVRLRAESMERIMDGLPMRIAVGIPTDLELNSTNVPTIRLASGEQIRRQAIFSENAEGLILLFSDLFIPEGGKLFIYTEDRTQVIVFSHETNPSGGAFSTSILYQDKIVLEYVESTVSTEQPRINIMDIGFVYNSNVELRNNLSCFINVNCSEGDGWELQRNGVVGLHVNMLHGAGRAWFICSGSLINNVRQDRTPFILSASHCFEGYDNITLSTMRFDFFKESVSDNCFDQSGTSPLTRTMQGANILADIPLKGGSDGTLLQLRNPIPTDWDVFFNGWDARGIAATSGVSIHHPAGLVKKISTFTHRLISVGNVNFDGHITAPNAHWQVNWAQTENGHSVTAGGSSGSPIFNEDGRIVGTLSGGSSECNSLMTRNRPDFYGKFSYHWNQYSDATQHFSRFLDPDNTGRMFMDGYPIDFNFANSKPVATEATSITANEFTANWESFPQTTSYLLSIYTKGNNDEPNFVGRYERFDVGNVLSYIVTGLEKGTRYYYTVVASNGEIFSQESNEIDLITMSSTGFVDSYNVIIQSISDVNLKIYNSSGQLIFSESISAGETTFPKNIFPVGVLFMKIGTEVHRILVW